MNANITPQTCRVECRKTWSCEHGASVPGGPFPGTLGSPGDVRRCEHGNVWLYEGDDASSRFDYWTRLRWWTTPIQYRRAILALAALT